MRTLLSALVGDSEAGATVAPPRFLPTLAREPPLYELRCRVALASTLLAGLELAREGEAQLEQEEARAPILVRVRPEPAAAVTGSGSGCC